MSIRAGILFSLVQSLTSQSLQYTPSLITWLPVPLIPAQSLLVVKCLEHNEQPINFVELNHFHGLLFILSSFAYLTQIPKHFRLESFQIKEHTPHTMLLLAHIIQHFVNLTTCLHGYTMEAAQFLFLKNMVNSLFLKHNLN